MTDPVAGHVDVVDEVAGYRQFAPSDQRHELAQGTGELEPYLLGGKIGHWRLIPADSPTFESEALHACDLLRKHDVRFGRVPQSRQTRPGTSRPN